LLIENIASMPFCTARLQPRRQAGDPERQQDANDGQRDQRFHQGKAGLGTPRSPYWTHLPPRLSTQQAEFALQPPGTAVVDGQLSK